MVEPAARSPHQVALVFAGGDPPPFGLAARLPADALVIAADSGLEHARVLGRHVDLAVGDFDSVSSTVLAEAEAAGTVLERHPAGKDLSDLELALQAAAHRSIDHLTIVGGHGGRLDHLLANLALMAAPEYSAMHVDGWLGVAYVAVVRDRIALTGRTGELCSLIPMHGTVGGVTITGFRYPLLDADLQPGSTWGLSNEFTAEHGEVALRSGTLVVVQPEALGA